jgi:hypothetical protein
MSSILLIYPPATKPCEPPAGIAKLCGTLRGHGLPCHLIDANLEGLLYLLNHPPKAEDTWTKRACKNSQKHLESLRTPILYKNKDRYQRAISDINRVLDMSARPYKTKLSLGNYQEEDRSPVNYADLKWSAAHPEKNVFFPYFSHRLHELIAENKPQHIGFSLNFLSQAATTFAMIGFLKQHYPTISIVLGGGLITSWSRSHYWHDFEDEHPNFDQLVDLIINGPGETALLNYLAKIDTTNFFPPDYSDLPLTDYLSPGFILPYAASSGCYWNRCNFCPERAEKNPYKPIRTSTMIAELSQLVEHYQPRLIHLLDNAMSPAHLRELVQSPDALNNTLWYGFTRISQQLSDLEFCRGLKQSGCIMLKLGIESGDQDVLNAMDKGVTVELTGQVLETLRQAGIATYVYLLFGTPTETEEKARKTLNFTQQYAHCINFLNLAIFNLPLSSTESATLKKQHFYAADLSLYTDFDHPLGWNRREIRQFLDQEFKRDPAIAQILRNDPPLFTSNHAAFFVTENIPR